jgi:hypothetical protein
MTGNRSLGQRVVARAAVGLWQQKQTLIMGALLSGAMVGYLLIGQPALPGVAAASRADCADAVLSVALGAGAPAVQQQAVQCMDASLQEHSIQQELAAQFGAAGHGPISKVSRLGTYDTENGGQLVYYAIDAGTQSLGVVVYVSETGKVTRIG